MAALVAKQGSVEWTFIRAGSINASECAAWELKHPYTKPKAVIRSQCRALAGANSEFKMNPAVQHGRDTEAEALEFLAENKGYTITEAGSIPHPKYPFLRGSPDGLVGLAGGVEAKCPLPGRPIYSVFDANKEMYLWQCRCVMECCGLDWIDFICYISPDEFHIDRVEREEGWLDEKVSGSLLPQPSDRKITRIDLWQAWHNHLHNEHQDPDLLAAHIAPLKPDAENIKNDKELEKLTKLQNRIEVIRDRNKDDLASLKELEDESNNLKKEIANRYGSSVTNGTIIVDVIKKRAPVDYTKIFEHFGGEDALKKDDLSLDDFRKTTNTRQVSIKPYKENIDG